MIGPFTLNHLAAAVIVLLALTCAVLAHKLVSARRQRRTRRYTARSTAAAKKDETNGQ